MYPKYQILSFLSGYITDQNQKDQLKYKHTEQNYSQQFYFTFKGTRKDFNVRLIFPQLNKPSNIRVKSNFSNDYHKQTYLLKPQKVA